MEHLCKAKRTDNNQWIEGYLLKDGVTGQYFIHANGNSVNESDKVNEEGFLQFVAFEIKEETICRYTGISDKSKNKIWEHDIVRSDYDEKPDKYYKCTWDDSNCTFIFIHGEERKDALSFLDKEYDLSVVGNSFDNPKLKTSDWVGREFKCVYGLDQGNIVMVISEPYWVRSELTVDTIDSSGNKSEMEIKELFSMYFEEIIR